MLGFRLWAYWLGIRIRNVRGVWPHLIGSDSSTENGIELQPGPA